MSEETIGREGEEIAGRLTCDGCRRVLEWCSFCDRTDCGAAVCYRCLLVDLGETLTQPHAHGG